jgi:putative ATP-dependent endonuclease of OLD family
MTPIVSEGFFSDSVVLVEGEEDRAALLGAAESLGKNFEREGISVIPVCGKNNLDRPYTIFRKLGIRTFLIFDSDNDKKNNGGHPEKNRALPKLLGKQPVDFPETNCWNEGACFKNNIQDTIKEQIGQELFNSVIDEVLKEFDLAERIDGIKNPGVMAEVMKRCATKGNKSELLERIIYSVIEVGGKRD